MSEPAQPTTNVDIANRALAALGQTVEVTSLESPTGKWAITCAKQYPLTRRRLLRGPRVFSFAKHNVQITVDAVATAAVSFGFASAFQLPTDCLRVLTLGDIHENNPRVSDLYDIRGRHIFTDETDGDDTLNLTYIRDVVTVGLWDAMFVHLCVLELANDMASAFAVRPAVMRKLDSDLKDARLEAGAVSGQENKPRRINKSQWTAARRLGGLGDPTRHSI